MMPIIAVCADGTPPENNDFRYGFIVFFGGRLFRAEARWGAKRCPKWSPRAGIKSRLEDLASRSDLEICHQDPTWRSGIKIRFGAPPSRSDFEIWHQDPTWRSGLKIRIGDLASRSDLEIWPQNLILEIWPEDLTCRSGLKIRLGFQHPISGLMTTFLSCRGNAINTGLMK